MDERVNEVQMEEQEINLLDLLRVVIKRKGMIVKLTVSVAIISIIYCLFLPNI